MSTNFITFHVPDDHKLLSSLGVVTLRHEHLNHMLKMTIKSIAQLTVADAMDATQYEGSRSLRKRICKLASQKFKEGKPLLKLQALMNRAGRLSDKRNKLTHEIWAKEHHGDAGVMQVNGELQPLPTVDELDNLSEELKLLTEELNDARLTGFIMIALEGIKN